MSENPNWTAWDPDAEQADDDRQVEINGLVPGEGDADADELWVFDNGELRPANQDDVDIIKSAGVPLEVGDPTADAHAVRQQDLNALEAGDVDAIPAAEKGASDGVAELDADGNVVGAVDDSEKGSPDGVATLDSDAELSGSQLPSVAITDVHIVESESDFTTLDAEQGDVAIPNNENDSSHILAEEPADDDTNWKELKVQEPPVSSVFGRTGDVTAQADDYSLSQIDNIDIPAYRIGPVSERPSSTDAADNMRWEATDQNLVYRNDPTNGWVVINHGSESNPVPEGHYESLGTEKTVSDTYNVDRDNNHPLLGWHEVETASDSGVFDVNLSPPTGGPYLIQVSIENITETPGDMSLQLRSGDDETRHEYITKENTTKNSAGSVDIIPCIHGIETSRNVGNLWMIGNWDIDFAGGDEVSLVSSTIHRRTIDNLEIIETGGYRSSSSYNDLRVYSRNGLEATVTLRRFEKL